MADLGFGTAYETKIFEKLFDTIISKYRINKILEFPKTNLLNQFKHKTTEIIAGDSESNYDLVWNFCHFEHTIDSAKFIAEISSKTDKYIFIIIQNNRHIGIILHWFYHKIFGKEWDHGKISKMSYRKLRKAIVDNGLVICEDGFHDVPWFILDVYECGNFLKKLVPSSLIEKQDIKPSRFEMSPRIIKTFLAHHYHVIAEKPISVD